MKGDAKTVARAKVVRWLAQRSQEAAAAAVRTHNGTVMLSEHARGVHAGRATMLAILLNEFILGEEG